MISFINSEEIFRYILMYLLIFEDIILMFIYYFIFRNKMKNKYVITLFTISIINVFILVIYSTIIKSIEKNRYNSTYDFFMNMPIVILYIISFILLFGIIYLLIKCIKYYKTVVTPSSIASGINSLEFGISICDMNSIPRLVNKYMDNISFKLINTAFTNDELFFKGIENNKENEILDNNNDVITVRNNGNVYRITKDLFYLNNLNYSRIIVNDITEEYNLLTKLKESNLVKEEYQKTLKEYSKSIEKITIEEEILNTKMNIHSNYGQMLIIGKSSIINKDQRKEFIHKWNNVSNLVFENESNDLDDLLYMAKTLDINLSINCDIKKDHEMLVVKLLYEVFTNTDKHTNSKNIVLDYEYSNNEHLYYCYNDEINKEDEFVEGGGLSSLRKLIEKNNASLRYELKPYFKVILVFKGE